MNKISLLLAVVLANAISFSALANDEAQLDATEREMSESASRPEFLPILKEKYGLTDEQIQKLTDSGISRPGMAMTAELAKQSGKSIDEILKMRTEDKMGWGKIAKSVGVPPGELGKAVASMRHERREGRRENRQDRREERAERRQDRREDRQERREERRENRQERRKERRANG